MIHGLKFVNFDKLDLGKEYLINFTAFNLKTARRCRLIKVTAKGYNFLDIERDKCILKRHLYVNKSQQICLVRSFRVTNFEIVIEQDKEKFVNMETII